MSNDLAVVERALAPLAPQFAQLLPTSMSPDRIIRTVLVSCEMQPKLLMADRGSLLRSAMTAAVLGLEVDGVTGQGYLVPFKGKVQFLPGYKGLVTIAGRSHRTLEGFVVREGDRFEFDEANGLIEHRRKLGNEAGRKIEGAYAVSRAEGAPTLVRVMSIDQLIETRNRSAGYKAMGDGSTWVTNFEGMCRKSPMRRLANDVPNISLQAASALETQHDLGREAYIRPDRSMVVDGEIVPPTGPQPPPAGLTDRPKFVVVYPNERTEVGDVARYKAKILTTLDKLEPDQARKFRDLNRANVEALALGGLKELGVVLDRLNAIEDPKWASPG